MRFLLFALLTSFMTAICGPAFATIYRLEIRQVNPDGPVYSVLCDNRMETCEIEIPFLSTDPDVRDETLSIKADVILDTYNARMRFKWEEAYLYMRPEEDGELHIYGYPNSKTKRVKLHVSPDRKALAELEVKFLRDTYGQPTPPPQKQPI